MNLGLIVISLWFVIAFPFLTISLCQPWFAVCFTFLPFFSSPLTGVMKEAHSHLVQFWFHHCCYCSLNHIFIQRVKSLIHIFLNILYLSPNILFVCFSSDHLVCIITSKSFSSVSLYIVSLPIQYVHVGLISLLPIFHHIAFMSNKLYSPYFTLSIYLFKSLYNSSKCLLLLTFFQ